MYSETVPFSASLYTWSFIALFSLCLGVMAWLYFRDSNEDTNLVRGYINHRLRKSRFGRMLVASGLNEHAYAADQSVPELRQQLRHCEQCDSTRLCDELLDQETVGDGQLGFCPNGDTILQAKADQLNRA